MDSGQTQVMSASVPHYVCVDAVAKALLAGEHSRTGAAIAGTGPDAFHHSAFSVVTASVGGPTLHIQSGAV